MPTPPPDYSAEDIDRRTRAAIAEVASILPSNAEEATLAAQYVGAKFYALDCLSLAGESRADTSCYLKCMAQAARTSREERGLRLLLQRLQAERRAREADSGATDRAAWTEYCAVGLMAEALGWQPPPAMPEPPAAAARGAGFRRTGGRSGRRGRHVCRDPSAACRPHPRPGRPA